ncbi:hypothetical protein H2198_000104 [Neophaeococcomyces mojaviensis]|uniref:Uncharacterized protein n=1 Tax=Neophaeococcomyces mojaviensis TaxID=3383035 RepID=A0ACC3ALN0_9EURO|nr:hypothetical protein H2198_000104 [Knufia sp. JES_112]
MAYWGIAYALGPNYNKAWIRFDAEDLKRSIPEATIALRRAQQLARHATPTERAVIEAASSRFPSEANVNDLTDFARVNQAYADAMRSVYHGHSNDLDVITLFVEALICIRPRRLWDLNTGEPTTEETVEGRVALERGMALPRGHDHPAFCHLYIHLMEMSPFPELALPAADRLRRLVPDGSHLQHMATHIDIACGDYRHGVDSNRDAMLVDDKYFAREKGSILYTVYRAHNIHVLIYAALMSGRQEDAISAAKRLPEVLTEEVLAIKTPPMADWAEGMLTGLIHALIRFGRWGDILQLEIPQNREILCSTTAMTFYARGIALGALGRIKEAEAAREDFEVSRATCLSTRLISASCKVVDMLKVASLMLQGEIEYRKGDFGASFSHLHEAIKYEDMLAYSDPPAWMQPVRHALGALLLEQGRVDEAETVFKEDLGLSDSLPRRKARINNVWGLHGLYECFQKSRKDDEARKIRLQRDIAMALADVPIQASCFCRLEAFEDYNRWGSSR